MNQLIIKAVAGDESRQVCSFARYV